MTANHRLLDNNDIMLIERVKQTNALYDPRHPEFRTYRKEQIWAQLATSLNMTPSDSKRRWTCLRDRYSRELKQMRKHPENEDYGKNEFFRQMDFLRKFVKVRRDRRSTASVVDYKSECSTASEKYEKVNNKVSEEYEEDAENTITEEEVTNSYDGTINKNRFEMKSAISNACTSYPEFVEEVGYEEYVDATQVNSETNKDNSNNKQHNASMPVLLDTTDNAFTAKAHAKCGTSPQQIVETIPHQTEFMQQKNEQPQQQPQQQQQTTVTETEDDFFSKSVAAYLRQLTRRNKIKAKVEMFQILEKYIELEEESRSSAQTNSF